MNNKASEALEELGSVFRTSRRTSKGNMSSDLTFITNETGTTLRDRFVVLLGENTRFFDRLVARAETGTLEREIDQQVYALYGLTPEEIQLVEGVR